MMCKSIILHISKLQILLRKAISIFWFTFNSPNEPKLSDIVFGKHPTSLSGFRQKYDGQPGYCKPFAG